MALPNHIIAEAIDTAPHNRGLKGADWLARPGNVAITFDGGDVILFDDEGDGTFQVHVLLRSRGREAIARVREAFRRMFVDHDCSLIFGMVPAGRGDVKMMARWTGMRSAGARYASEIFGGPADTKYELFVLSKIQWKVAGS